MDPNLVRLARAIVALYQILETQDIEIPDLDARLIALAQGRLQ